MSKSKLHLSTVRSIRVSQVELLGSGRTRNESAKQPYVYMTRSTIVRPRVRQNLHFVMVDALHDRWTPATRATTDSHL
jgi:hypothetical protein